MVGMTEHGLVNCLFNRGTITSKFSFGKNRGDKKANSEKQSHFSMVYLMFGKQTIPRNALKHRIPTAASLLEEKHFCGLFFP